MQVQEKVLIEVQNAALPILNILHMYIKKSSRLIIGIATKFPCLCAQNAQGPVKMRH